MLTEGRVCYTEDLETEAACVTLLHSIYRVALNKLDEIVSK